MTEENRLNLRNKLTVSASVRPEAASGVQNIVNKWYAPDSYALAVRDGGRFVFTVAFDGGRWGTTVDVWSPGYDATLQDPSRGFAPVGALGKYRDCP